ncbi:MAG: hypothetical protein AB9846_01875 [Tenuifilaceae bacterium]
MGVNRLIFLLTFYLLSFNAFAQDNLTIAAKANHPKMADSLFSAGNYKLALPLFLELNEKFPQDNRYSYSLGVCYLYSTREINLAISYLTKASTGEVPNKVYFYLAEGYRFTYKFDQAIDFYRRFVINGGSPDIKTNEVERYVNLCENGNFLLKYIYAPQVIDKEEVGINDFFEFYSIMPKTGSFVQKPNDLKTPVDLKQNESSILFYPKNPQSGDYIYYSSYGKTNQYGKDIFRIKRLDDGFWSKPENLGDAVNSAEDEDYPYMSADGVTLYFASKGHYSIGGYDIYRSIYNSKTKKWSTPENLGFPFSSPFDDFLYLPDEKDSIACFATNRDCIGEKLHVCMIKVEKDPIRRSFSSIEEVQKIAKLQVTNIKSEKQNIVSNSQQEKDKSVALEQKQKSASFNSVENDPEYIRVITKGFSKQKETDSLRIKLEKLREGFDYVTTAEQRRSLESKVVKVEDALLAAQNEADKMFAQASQIEQDYLTGKRKPQGKIDASFTTDNPDYLYQAQFAPTVFRSDEINKLAQIEKLQNQINAAREEAVAAKAKYANCISSLETITKDCELLNVELDKKMSAYISVFSKLYDVKFRIYTDCVTVAIVKSGNNNGDDARAEVDRANSHFRAATAIKNNLSAEGRVESLFESAILNEIGILRLELAFARAWGMNLFEQQTTSNAIKLEKIAFGNPLPPIVGKTKKEDVVVEPIAKPKEKISISKVDYNLVSAEPIMIKKDEPLPFQVVDQSPYNAQNPIPVDEQFPSGVIYKIQLGAYSKLLDVSFFKGMIPVSGEKVSGGKVTKYYVGKFKTLTDAEQALPVVRSKGFKDAFVIAWLNGKTLPLTRAQTLEDKHSEEQNIINKPANTSDTTSTSNKIYQIQIGKFDGRLPDDISRTVKALAIGKDIIRRTDAQGKTIYLISSYTNIEDANRIKDNLIAAGISGAVVVDLSVKKK